MPVLRRERTIFSAMARDPRVCQGGENPGSGGLTEGWSDRGLLTAMCDMSRARSATHPIGLVRLALSSAAGLAYKSPQRPEKRWRCTLRCRASTACRVWLGDSRVHPGVIEFRDAPNRPPAGQRFCQKARPLREYAVATPPALRYIIELLSQSPLSTSSPLSRRIRFWMTKQQSALQSQANTQGGIFFRSPRRKGFRRFHGNNPREVFAELGLPLSL